MCECAKCVTINLLNGIMSIVLVFMNCIYAVWGFILPRSDARVEWKNYAEKLETYLNVVSYSDSLMIPLKITTMLLAKWCCCKCNKMSKDEDSDPIEKYGSTYCVNTDQYCSSVSSSRTNSVSTFCVK